MKNKLLFISTIILLVFVFILSSFSIYLLRSNSRYDNKDFLSAISSYIPLIENIDFTYLKIVDDKMFFTIGSDNVLEMEISKKIQEKTKEINLKYAYKSDGMIFFVLDGAIDDEVGVFFSKNGDIVLKEFRPRNIERLSNFSGNGVWYYYSTF